MALIDAVTTSPSYNQMIPAYRPIVIVAKGLANQCVYCDIYFEDVYYKTLMSNTKYGDAGGGKWYYYFDLADAAKEFLKTYTPGKDGYTTINYSGGIFDSRLNFVPEHSPTGFVACHVQIRGSVTAAYNVIQPETPIPVQATADTPAVGSIGVWSTTFRIFNAALKQGDVPGGDGFRMHLESYRNWEPGYGLYNMSTFKEQKIGYDDYAIATGYVTELGFPGNTMSANVTCFVRIWYWDNPNPNFYIDYIVYGSHFLNHVVMFYVPTGTKNINIHRTVFQASQPIVWFRVNRYQVYLNNGASNPKYPNTIIWASPMYYPTNVDSVTKNRTINGSPYAIPKKRERLWYRNSLGCLEQINFQAVEEFLDIKSTTFETVPDNTAVTRGVTDFNKKAQTSQLITGHFEEWEMPQIRELLLSTMVWKEVQQTADNRKDGNQPFLDDFWRGDTLFSMRLVDQKIQLKKYEERYIYEVTIEVANGQTEITLRN